MHVIGFFIGNILKYAQRYGRKGHRIKHRKVLMKVLHYAIIALSEHDKTKEEEEDLWTIEQVEADADNEEGPW